MSGVATTSRRLAAQRSGRAPSGERATDAAGRNGFTLISVLVAVVLLTIGLLALARTQTALIASQANEGWRTSALSVARSYMEEIRARDPWDLAPEAAVSLDATGQPDASGPLRRSLQVNLKSQNLVEVRVIVATTRKHAPVELVTYIYRGAK